MSIFKFTLFIKYHGKKSKQVLEIEAPDLFSAKQKVRHETKGDIEEMQVEFSRNTGGSENEL